LHILIFFVRYDFPSLERNKDVMQRVMNFSRQSPRGTSRRLMLEVNGALRSTEVPFNSVGSYRFLSVEETKYLYGTPNWLYESLQNNECPYAGKLLGFFNWTSSDGPVLRSVQSIFCAKLIANARLNIFFPSLIKRRFILSAELHNGVSPLLLSHSGRYYSDFMSKLDDFLIHKGIEGGMTALLKRPEKVAIRKLQGLHFEFWGRNIISPKELG
jgi:hypothetical protein